MITMITLRSVIEELKARTDMSSAALAATLHALPADPSIQAIVDALIAACDNRVDDATSSILRGDSD
jgi:hypothetical protein